jgi:Domain of unknown function (DUF6457)
MDAWIDRLAQALGEEQLTQDQTTRLLRTSRDVAHRVERKLTPLAAFLIGSAVGGNVARGASRADALQATLETVAGLLPPSEEVHA